MRTGPVLRTLGLVIIGGLAVTAYAAAQGGPKVDPARGEHLVKQNCSGCHAVAKTGDSPNALAPAFRTLSERYPVENLEEALAEGILVSHEGVVQMPEFTFSPEDITDIIAYLRRIQTK